jgi:sulfide:quinone oxidoreductase
MNMVAPRTVVIAGGGVGAVEALLALRDLSDGTFDLTVAAPDERFTLQALTVAEPFAAGMRSDVGSLPEIVEDAGATFHQARVTEVRPDDHIVVLSDGDELSYDALVLSPGARRRAAYQPALSFGLGDPSALNGLLADLEQGYCDSVAFVVPTGVSWSLPLYELALMTARQVASMGREPELILATPEPAPLAIFGPEASAAVGELLDAVGITVHSGTPVAVSRGSIQLAADTAPIAVSRVVTLPVLEGPRVPGVPATADGFIPVDDFCRVAGLADVYAIGDAADLLVKQGGLACQQADVAARHIAAEAGGSLPAAPLEPVLRGRLLTGGSTRFLRRDMAGEDGSTSKEALWWPPAKVSGHYLGPWLAHREAAGASRSHGADHPPPAPPPGIEVRAPLRRDPRSGTRHQLGLDSLGRMHD